VARASEPDYRDIAAFRSALRSFESLAEDAARAAGLTPQRYLLLLMILGAPDGSKRATINEIAARLKIESHSITGAVIRAEEAGLVVREACKDDRRRTWVKATDEGVRRLDEALALLESQREPLLPAVVRVVKQARSLGLIESAPSPDGG
jgi:DNA-binding MarR family transcriptional regulator